ncbi:MAG: hypothetical protein V4515_14465 [Chloroflexota bacterium]
MTYADPALIEARNYLISLGIPGDAIGIVGDQSHQSTGGYHVGNDVLAQIGKLTTDYSKRQTDRDRPGSNAAMALDIGGLSGQQLYELTAWLIAQCRAGAPDARNIREVIGRESPAGGIVHYDALGIQTGEPAGHDTHTHISYFRDSEGENKTALLRRYYQPAPTPQPQEDEDMGELFHVIDTEGTQVTTDDRAVFAVVGGGVCRVRKLLQTTANKLAGKVGDSTALTGAEWNDLLDLYAVAGFRADASGNVAES